MISKDIIACNGFGFKGGWGTLTERVVAHPPTLFPFPPGFLYDRKKLNQRESIIAYKVPLVPIYIFKESCNALFSF